MAPKDYGHVEKLQSLPEHWKEGEVFLVVWKHKIGMAGVAVRASLVRRTTDYVTQPPTPCWEISVGLKNLYLRTPWLRKEINRLAPDGKKRAIAAEMAGPE